LDDVRQSIDGKRPWAAKGCRRTCRPVGLG
jgi:hypothetical protein